MIKFLFLLVFLFSSIVTAKINPALWQIEHQGQVSYLFGSMHIGQASWYPLNNHIEQAFKASDSLVVELDMTRHEERVQAEMFLPAGQNISQHLSNQTYQKLLKFLSTEKIPHHAIASLKPWALTNTLAVLPFLKLGLTPAWGIDAQMLTRAKQSAKPLIELETVEFQLNLLSTMFADEEALLETITMPADESLALLQAWQIGDLSAIEKMLKQQMSDQQYQMMLVERNVTWVKRLKGLLNNKQRLFIVVGAAHLVGKDGVPALLRQQGIKVSRLQ
ncbi:MAG: TraB/GumN family protein [Gammaproteobacteria bacterium]|nr:TraB/GumN family protein [Gammaproteobacteria bacterium]